MFDAFKTGTGAQVWQELVQEAAGRVGHPLDESGEAYLVFMLLRYQGDAWLLSHVLGLDWLDAHNLVGTARADTLRDVGDRCLLVAGLFPGLAERRRVNVDYYIDIGRSAYQGVAEVGRQAYAALYRQLARSYLDLVETLNAVRSLAQPELIRLTR